jgi:hypothetical protein
MNEMAEEQKQEQAAPAEAPRAEGGGQREGGLGVAIKRARNIALLPFAGSAAGATAPKAVEAHKS